MLLPMLSALPHFLSYLTVGLSLLTVFLWIYIWFTPYDELALIRGGNIAAATTLSGTMLGFALPIANVIAHSDTLLDLLAWGVIAGIIQLGTYLIARLAMPTLGTDIPANQVAPAVFLAVLSITVGIINAACMTY